MFTLEKENTFEINKEDVSNVIENIILNRKNILIDGDNYILSKPKKKVEIHLLCSGNFCVTRNSNGIRERLKYKLKKKSINIIYSPKKFEDGSRYQEDIELGENWDKALEYVENMGKIDAVMLKYSYKYKCFNSMNNNVLKISIDCCYAVNPQDSLEISNPFFYLEIENEEGDLLKAFRESEFYNKIAPYLNDLTYKSHNKILKCINAFENKYFYPNSVEELKTYITNIKKNYYEDIAYDYLNDFQSGFMKGNNPIERGDRVEVELKFDGYNSHNEVIDIIRPLIPDTWSLHKTPPRIIEDIYFDTDDLMLYKHNSHFRIRKQKINEGWISCFKTPLANNSVCLERRKVKTKLENNEILQYKVNSIHGKSAEEVYKFLNSVNSNNLCIKPKILINEYRERYVIRPFKINNENDNKLTSIDLDIVRGSEIIHIIFDTVVVYDITNVDIEYLLKTREIDCTNRNINSVSFTSAEIEPSYRVDVKKDVEEIYDKICKNISSKYNVHTNDKYQISVNKLSL